MTIYSKIPILKKAFFLFLFITIFLSEKSLLAKDALLLRAKEASRLEFQAFLRTDTPFTSFEEFYIKERPFIKTTHPLETHLKEAQKAFLSGNFDRAQDHFQKLIAMKLLEDWSYHQRKTLHYALLRLIQFSESEIKKRHLIEEAKSFAPFMALDTQLFPPFLVKRMKNSNTIKNLISWFPSEKIQKFSTLLINGKVYKKPFIQPLLLPPEEDFRITLLSNAFHPTSRIGKQKDLNQWNPPEEAFVKGNCENFKISSPLLLKQLEPFKRNIFIFFKSNCIQPLKGVLHHTSNSQSNKTQTYKKRTPKKNLKSLSLSYDRYNLSKEEPQNLFQRSHKIQGSLKTTQTHFLNNKWFWIGASAFITTSLSLTLYSLNKKNLSHIKPSKKRGF